MMQSFLSCLEQEPAARLRGMSDLKWEVWDKFPKVVIGPYWAFMFCMFFL